MKFALSLPVLALPYLLGRAQARSLAATATAAESEDGQEHLRGLNQDERELANKCLTHSGKRKPNGTPCDKGKCWINERCYDGFCYGSRKCTYDEQCQEPLECHRPSGTCYNPAPGDRALLDSLDPRELTDQPPINKPDGTPCAVYTYDDRCVDGACVANPRKCDWVCGQETPIPWCSVYPWLYECLCSLSTEGVETCWNDYGDCEELPKCETSADCPSGTACVQTCCDEPLCVPLCSVGGRSPQAKAKREGDGDGKCVPTPTKACP